MATQTSFKVGDRVQCQFYNHPDGGFYGDTWVGEIKAIELDYETSPGFLTPYLVNCSGSTPGSPDTWLSLREIKRIH